MSEPKDLQTLLARVTERRRELLTSVVNRRTRHFCMVLEDLFDPHNISAVIRTAEVFGLQDVHIIEEDNAYSVNKSILKGSYKWMSLSSRPRPHRRGSPSARRGPSARRRDV